VFPGGGVAADSTRSGKSAGRSRRQLVPGTSGRSCAPPYQRAKGYVRVYALLAGAARLRRDRRQHAADIDRAGQAGARAATAGPGDRGRRIPGARHGRAHTGAVRARDGLRTGMAGNGVAAGRDIQAASSSTCSRESWEMPASLEPA